MNNELQPLMTLMPFKDIIVTWNGMCTGEGCIRPTISAKVEYNFAPNARSLRTIDKLEIVAPYQGDPLICAEIGSTIALFDLT